GPPEQRLAYAILVGELAGPAEGRAAWERLRKDFADNGVELTATQTELTDILGRLYRDYADGQLDAPSADEAERQLLRDELDWFGDLALAPADGPDPAKRAEVLNPAYRVFVLSLVAFLGGGLVCLAGFIGLVVLGILLLTGNLRRGLETGLPHA